MAVRDEAILLIVREQGVRRRLRSRWGYVRDLHDDIEQDVYLHLLELWQRPDKREMVRECMSSRQTLAAVVDMLTKKALAKYGRDVRESEESAGEYIPYRDMADEISDLARYLPTKERCIYEQWIECRYNCQTLANLHGVSKAWMNKYIGNLNRKIKEIWERLC